MLYVNLRLSLEAERPSVARAAELLTEAAAQVATGKLQGQPNDAVRVTPGILALRRKGLLGFVRRRDGRSGSCDALTDAGRARVLEILGTIETE